MFALHDVMNGIIPEVIDFENRQRRRRLQQYTTFKYNEKGHLDTKRLNEINKKGDNA